LKEFNENGKGLTTFLEPVQKLLLCETRLIKADRIDEKRQPTISRVPQAPKRKNARREPMKGEERRAMCGKAGKGTRKIPRGTEKGRVYQKFRPETLSGKLTRGRGVERGGGEVSVWQGRGIRFH